MLTWETTMIHEHPPVTFHPSHTYLRHFLTDSAKQKLLTFQRQKRKLRNPTSSKTYPSFASRFHLLFPLVPHLHGLTPPTTTNFQICGTLPFERRRVQRRFRLTATEFDGDKDVLAEANQGGDNIVLGHPFLSSI